MSKSKGKRGFVAPQVNAPAVSSFSQALASFDAAERASDAWCRKHENLLSSDYSPEQKAERDRLSASYRSALDELFGVRATTAADLADKIASLYWLMEDVEYNPRTETAAEIITHGSDADQALLACYLDAKALAGDSPRPSDDGKDEVAALAARFETGPMPAWDKASLELSTEEWAKHRFYLHVAGGTLARDKDGLLALVRDLGLDGDWGPSGDSAFGALLTGLHDLETRATEMAKAAHVAHCRLLAAAAKAMHDDEEAAQ
ncbi:hypothetical protein ACO2Q1_00300 [Brevundimonas sp. VNH65]|uniref:hypothetical protein n=1 Tax=Brevundimonas sp. VNH65 TaxID=3400917 RepID=UPI003C0A66E7